MVMLVAERYAAKLRNCSKWQKVLRPGFDPGTYRV